ncbi:cell division protein FtsB [Vibrio sp. DW001]|uniref:cell division protein FtsB n=1 Tax=unclassified Vibrio TaxID=2614977 RepID=UPI00189E9D48|nr:MULTISPECIES: cell division protein FtsB [unclassified Vibrio]UGA55203.1 cell division protein FtsB [Vibrio sp. VB16]WED27096.1 cell division protein FtsB [Vibrio sp. DW001]
MRLFTLALVLLFSLLIYTLVWGKNGMLERTNVVSEIEVQQSVNRELNERNAKMFAEIEDLRQGLDAIEERARNELGLVKEGETFYRIIDDSSQ